MSVDVSVDLTGRADGLALLASTTRGAGINIRGVCVYRHPAGVTGHVLLDEPVDLDAALGERGLSAGETTDVVVLDLEDRPGTLEAIAGSLAEAGVELEFAYTSGPWLVLGTRDAERCRSALRAAFGLDDHENAGRGRIRAMDPSLAEPIVAPTHGD